MTTIFVTHDQTEAMTLADRIVCLNEGRVAQVGTPEELYTRPCNTFVAAFIGSPQINLFEAEVVHDGASVMLRLSDGQTLTAPNGVAASAKSGVLVGIRPEDLTDETRLRSFKDVQTAEPSRATTGLVPVEP